MERSLDRLAGYLEGKISGIDETLTRIDRRLEDGQRIMLQHADLHRDCADQRRRLHARLQALETAPSRSHSPLQLDLAEVLKAVAPAGGWAPWLLVALLALKGIIAPEQLRDWLPASQPAVSVGPARE